VEHAVHILFQIKQGGAFLDGKRILLHATQIAIDLKTNLVQKEDGKLETKGAKQGHGGLGRISEGCLMFRVFYDFNFFLGAADPKI
jgi:hypothetical protein